MVDRYLKMLNPSQSFTLTSKDISSDDPTLPIKNRSKMTGIPGASDISPELTWSNVPEGTKSFVLTMFDPDAPTGSGFWHWAIKDIPASTTHLDEGAGTPDGTGLPQGASHIPNDVRVPGYIGAAPRPGTGLHHYVFVLHALSVEKVDAPSDATPAFLSSRIAAHTIARAVLVATVPSPEVSE